MFRQMDRRRAKKIIVILGRPEFDAEDVDPDLHRRMDKAIQGSRIKCLNMCEGPVDGDQDLKFGTRELEGIVREMEDPIFKGNKKFKFEMDLDELGKRLYGGGVAFQIGQLRHIP
jgi:hypothetical protein